MSRAHLLWQWNSEVGDRIPAATVDVFQVGTTTPITETIYVNDEPDASILPNPFTSDANGIAEFFLTNAKRVDLRFSKAGFTTQTIRNLDVTHVANRLTHRGAYAGATTYNEDDWVTFDGESWYARRTVTGVSPVEGADWTRMARKGTGGILETIIDAKGDLLLGTAADTIARRAIGSEGTVLTARAAQATGVAWEAIPVPALPTIVRKTADESVVSSTTLQDDDHLLLALGANETWVFECVVITSGGVGEFGTGDIKIGFTGPSGSTIAFSAHPHIAVGATTPGASTVTAGGSTISLALTNTKRVVALKGIVRNGATPGNLQLRWAQNASNAAASHVHADSFLLAHKQA